MMNSDTVRARSTEHGDSGRLGTSDIYLASGEGDKGIVLQRTLFRKAEPRSKCVAKVGIGRRRASVS